MKHALSILPVLILPVFLSAQITITQEDIETIYQPGNTYYYQLDTIGSLQVGSPGGPNTWNFTNMAIDVYGESEILSPENTPYKSLFPSADVAVKSEHSLPATELEKWEYFNLIEDQFNQNGNVTIHYTNSDKTEIINQYIQGDLRYILPVFHTGSWITDVDTIQTDTLINGNLFTRNTSIYYTENFVDGFGTLILPNGRTFEALRILSDRFISNAIIGKSKRNKQKTRSFHFITSIGEKVSITTTTDTAAYSGPIQGLIHWQSTVPVGIESLNEAKSISHINSLPNPFSSTTNIHYRLQNPQRIQITLFSLLGRPIIQLQDQIQAPGHYRINWSGLDAQGSTIPAGIYLCQIRTATQQFTIKLVKQH